MVLYRSSCNTFSARERLGFLNDDSTPSLSDNHDRRRKTEPPHRRVRVLPQVEPPTFRQHQLIATLEFTAIAIGHTQKEGRGPLI